MAAKPKAVKSLAPKGWTRYRRWIADTGPGGLGRWVVELLLTFRPEQLFEHFIGRRDDLGCGRKSPLHHDHLGELLPDIDGRLLQRGLTDSAT